MAQISAAKADENGKKVDIKKDNGVWEYAEAEKTRSDEAEEEFPDSCTFWGYREGTSLENRELNRSTKAAVIELLGDVRSVLPDAPRLFGEPDECLLSGDLADELFGSGNVQGEELFYHGRRLVVRGTLNQMDGTIVLPASPEGTSIMDTISFRVNPEKETQNDPVQAFLMRHGIQGQVPAWEYLAVGTKILVWILPLVIFLTMSRRMVKLIRMNSQKIWRKALQAAVFVILTVLFVLLFWPDLSTSGAIFPTKWSDFSFWGRTALEVQERIELLLKIEKTGPGYRMVVPFVDCLKYSILTMVLYVILRRMHRTERVAIVLSKIVISWILLLLFLCFLGPQGAYLADSKSAWFGAAYWLVSASVIDNPGHPWLLDTHRLQ